jgi:hypothetical protein
LYHAEKILDAGANRVVALFHQRGKPAARLVGRVALRDRLYGGGRFITRGKVYATPEEALEAAGLSE